MILSKDQIVFCRIKAKCLWPAQVKTTKRGGGIELVFLNRPDLDVQCKPESDIISFEEGIDKAKNSRQQGIEQAIDKASEIIETQKKSKKTSSFEYSSKIKVDNTTPINNKKSVSKEKGEISKAKAPVEIQKYNSSTTKQKIIEPQLPKERQTTLANRNSQVLQQSSKILAAPPATKTRSETACTSKKEEAKISPTKKISEKEIQLQLGVKRRREQTPSKIEPIPTKKVRSEIDKENISVHNRQSIVVDHFNKKESLIKKQPPVSEQKSSVGRVQSKKDEKVSEKSLILNSKRENENKLSKMELNQKLDDKLSGKRYEVERTKNTEPPRKESKQKEKSKGTSKHEVIVEKEKKTNQNIEEKEEEIEFEVGSPRKDSASKRLDQRKQQRREDDYENQQDSPQFGFQKSKQQDDHLLQFRLNDYLNNHTNNQSYSMPSRNMNNNNNWNTTSTLLFSNPNHNHNNNSNNSNTNYLPQFGNNNIKNKNINNNSFNNSMNTFTNKSSSQVYFDATDELNFATLPPQEEKVFSILEQQNLLYTGLKTGVITAQQYEFLSEKLKQQQLMQQQASQQQLNISTPQRIPLSNITQQVHNTEQSVQSQYSSQQQQQQQQQPSFSYPKLSQSQSQQPQHIQQQSINNTLSYSNNSSSSSSREIPSYNTFEEQRQPFSPIKSFSESNSNNVPVPKSSPSQSQSYESCQIRQKLQFKILPMLENKAKNKVYYENEKDMWLCEIVDCVRQLKIIPAVQLYEGEYSVLLEQIYDTLHSIQEQTKRNFQYVLNMIQRTMADLDKKVIKYLHESSQPSSLSPNKSPGTKVEDNSLNMRLFQSNQQQQPHSSLIQNQINSSQSFAALDNQRQQETKENMILSPPKARILKFQETESTSKKYGNNGQDNISNSNNNEVLLISQQQQATLQQNNEVKEEFQV